MVTSVGTCFAADDDNDMYCDPDTGIIYTVQDVLGLEQMVSASIQLLLGEYDFDTTIGINWFSYLGEDSSSEAIIIYQLRQNIMNCNDYLTTSEYDAFGISKIKTLSISVDRITRQGTVTGELLLNNNGSILINEVIG